MDETGNIKDISEGCEKPIREVNIKTHERAVVGAEVALN